MKKMNGSDSDLPEFPEFFQDLMSSMAKQDSQKYEELKSLLSNFEPFKTAAVFCGLATIGSLQSNHIRISNLIHAALKFGLGTKSIKQKHISHLFNLLDKSDPARAEDPAEDVFVANLSSQRGTFKIFEGNWEAATFYLERFIDIVDSMPDSDRFNQTKRSVYGLLTLSNHIAEKNKIIPNTITGQYPVQDLNSARRETPESLKKRVAFSIQELEQFGFKIEDIEPFIFDAANISKLPFPSHHQLLSLLEKQPVLSLGNNKFCLYPQAVSTAIRSFILRHYTGYDKDMSALRGHLIASYYKILSSSLFFGRISYPPLHKMPSRIVGDLIVMDAVLEAYKGRPLHLIFLFDDFKSNIDDWANQNPVKTSDSELNIPNRIEEIKASLKSSEIKHGITLVILAGWGRPSMFAIKSKKTDNWSIQVISAHDLFHLSDYPGITPTDLWRITQAKEKLFALGGRIRNFNGFLNLYGWLVENNWHIVPHEQLPKENDRTMLEMHIGTEYIAKIRETARLATDRKFIPYVDGQHKYVLRRMGRSFFNKQLTPIYFCQEEIRSKIYRSAYSLNSTVWWCSIKNSAPEPAHIRIWDSALKWLPAIAEALQKFEIAFPELLEWQLDFENEKEQLEINQIASVKQNDKTIITSIKLPPNSLFHKSTNCGEKSLIESFLKEILQTGYSDLLPKLINSIFPDSFARHSHFLPARSYGDYVADKLPSAILLHGLDDANLRLGLGWSDEKKARFQRIADQKLCVQHIGRIVDKVWKDIEIALKSFSNSQLCQKLMLNIDSIRNEKRQWERTAAANLSMNDDKEKTISVINEELGKLNAANLASRILVEMAVCTCPETAKFEPDELDISILLGQTILLFNLGSWSDAINLGIFPPEIEISSFGQLMLDYSFDKTVISQYHSAYGKKIIEVEAERYFDLFSQSADRPSLEERLPQQFVTACKSEFQIPLNQLPSILDCIEDIGLTKAPTFTVSRSELVAAISHMLGCYNEKEIDDFIAYFTLPARDRWDQNDKCLPDGYKQADWFPWNFRRRLSLISKPIVALNSDLDPLLLISPETIREGVWYNLDNSLDGTFAETNFDSPEMKKWIGDRRNELGNKFNNTVASRLKELGWKTEPELTLPKILNKHYKDDLGDIDVLAWSEQNQLVVAIECKDLFFAKTTKELGHQINEFMGNDDKDGKPDRLKRHFRRLDELSENLSGLRKFLGLSNITEIYGLVVFSQQTILEYAPQVPKDRICFCSFDNLASPDKLKNRLMKWAKL